MQDVPGVPSTMQVPGVQDVPGVLSTMQVPGMCVYSFYREGVINILGMEVQVCRVPCCVQVPV